jgi:PPM family protein phosphatase
MPVCEHCGQENRAVARFCFSCAAPLAALRPNEEDRQWLAASLISDDAVASATGVIGPLADCAEEESIMDDQPAPTLFAGRFELPATALEGLITVVDTQPWRRCWACGSGANEPGDAFCNDCGAALTRREYQASLSPRADPTGEALIAMISDEAARALLPELAAQVEDADQLLTLLHDSGRGPLATPLDETTALTIGAGLAGLVAHLHAVGLALGSVTPTELEALPSGTRLRSASNLRRVTDDERDAAIQSDLAALAELLEQLTETPRTTQRLSEDEAAQALADGEPGLAVVLRQIRTGDLASAAAVATRLEAILADRTQPIALRQIVGAQTDTGIVRDHNEDSYFTIQLGLDNSSRRQSWGFYCVSDGMGGHAAGEVASGLAVRAAVELVMSEYLAHAMQADAVFNEGEARDLVRRAVLRANEAIVTESRSQGNDMGATLTVALVVGDRVIVGNVGDSRAYLYRDEKLQRISKDHSLVQRLVDLGQISDDEIYTHPQRNAVLRSLGDRAEVEVDVFSERVRADEALMLCSDGQWEMTRDPAMALMIARAADPQVACDVMVAAANQAGGEDNITVVLVDFA